MAVDEALTEGCRSGESLPVFRTFGWIPAAISFGYTQDPAEEFELATCQSHGIGLVRRLTGGRAVYHDKEVTYSVIVADDDPIMAGSVHEAYFNINQGLAKGLTVLGIDTEFEKSKFEPDREKIKSPCFTSAARFELNYQGRKIVGSAQRKFDNVLLQHGSILLEGHQVEMVDLTNFEARKKDILKNYLLKKTTSASEILNRLVSYEEMVTALKAGFAEQTQIEFITDELTIEEQKRVTDLVERKYSQPDWNFKKKRYEKNQWSE